MTLIQHNHQPTNYNNKDEDGRLQKDKDDEDVGGKTDKDNKDGGGITVKDVGVGQTQIMRIVERRKLTRVMEENRQR